MANDSFGVSINNTDFYAHESATLDISSDSLGILIPRISLTNRPSSPAEWLLVYQIDNSPGFYYFNGTAWQKLSATPSSAAKVAFDWDASRSAQATLRWLSEVEAKVAKASSKMALPS